MGKSAEVYDAEMLALLRGLEAAIAFQQNTPETSRRQPTIILFADNTSAVEVIMKGNPDPKRQKWWEDAVAEMLPISFPCVDSILNEPSSVALH
jgi:hypothetical protein